TTAPIEPVQLVHAALVFEHAGTDGCLQNALGLVSPGGAFSVVLQLPGAPGAEVAATPFPSMRQLKADFRLIDPADFQRTVTARGFHRVYETQRALPAGKAFWMAIFRERI